MKFLELVNKRYSARSYKAKFVEPLIAKLKSLIKTLFARYFKAIDSYNRLNVTNRNLYRENEKLSKMRFVWNLGWHFENLWENRINYTLELENSCSICYNKGGKQPGRRCSPSRCSSEGTRRK